MVIFEGFEGFWRRCFVISWWHFFGHAKLLSRQFLRLKLFIFERSIWSLLKDKCTHPPERLFCSRRDFLRSLFRDRLLIKITILTISTELLRSKSAQTFHERFSILSLELFSIYWLGSHSQNQDFWSRWLFYFYPKLFITFDQSHSKIKVLSKIMVTLYKTP